MNVLSQQQLWLRATGGEAHRFCRDSQTHSQGSTSLGLRRAAGPGREHGGGPKTPYLNQFGQINSNTGSLGPAVLPAHSVRHVASVVRVAIERRTECSSAKMAYRSAPPQTEFHRVTDYRHFPVTGGHWMQHQILGGSGPSPLGH